MLGAHTHRAVKSERDLDRGLLEISDERFKEPAGRSSRADSRL